MVAVGILSGFFPDMLDFFFHGKLKEAKRLPR